ncbi:MAG: anti-sigma factor [Actinomycetota bacterium]
MDDMTGRNDIYELDELLGAYALDAVDPDEARRVEDYLAINPKAAAEVADHREVATMLAFTGMEAPDDLWGRIASELDDDPERPAPGPELQRIIQASATAPVPPAVPAVEQPGAAVTSLDEARQRRRWSSSMAWVAGSAAAAVVAVVAITVVVTDRADAPTDPLIAAIETARADIDSVETTLVAENFAATADAVIGQDGRGYLEARELPVLADDQTYQLWGVVSDGQVISLGILGPNLGLETFTVEGDVSALAITIEDAPGVIADGNPDGAFVGTF